VSAPFTPGPWRVGAGACHSVYSSGGPASFKLGEFYGKRPAGEFSSEEDAANALLAAAAPELLAALQDCRDWMARNARASHGSDLAKALDAADAALKKASGR
jgi:hypothetical protein